MQILKPTLIKNASYMSFADLSLMFLFYTNCPRHKVTFNHSFINSGYVKGSTDCNHGNASIQKITQD